MKKTVTDVRRRYSTRILLKKQNVVKNKKLLKVNKKKKDLEMLTPVAQAVTDRLYDDDKIYKGGPVKKFSTKATRGRGRARKTSSVNSTVV